MLDTMLEQVHVLMTECRAMVESDADNSELWAYTTRQLQCAHNGLTALLERAVAPAGEQLVEQLVEQLDEQPIPAEQDLESSRTGSPSVVPPATP